MSSQALQKINYGMYIVTSGTQSECNGQIANTVFQVTSEPETIAVSINKQNFTHEFIRKTGFLAVSVLSRNASMKLIGGFGFRCGKDFDKFEGVTYKVGKTGIKIVLDGVIAYIEAKVDKEVDLGTHTLFIARVVDTEVLSDDEPMTYAFYHEIKKGLTPSTAPTYSKTSSKQEGKDLTKYKCQICGYIYDPSNGDPDGGIRPGTLFEELPDSWVCPVCGATKDQFEKIE